MKDTRMLQARGLAENIITITAELLEETISDPQEMLHVACMHQLAKDIAKRANLIYEAERCGDTNTVGSVCVLPGTHEGPHAAVHGFQWTDESNRLAGKFIARQLGGRD